MRRTPVLVTVASAALLLAGCGVSHDAPRPGVAAEVDGHTLSLTDLDDLVDAVCTVNAEDPQGQPTTRGIASQQKVTQWIQAQVVLDYAHTNDLTIPTTEQDLSGAPGWDRLTSDQQAELQRFADAQNEASAVAKANPGLSIDPAGLDVVINPRFDVEVSGDSFVPTDRQLSVAVSDQAKTDSSQPTAKELAALPASQLCGKRPVIGATTAQ